MEIFNGLHAFLWESMTVNNCNSYFIDGPTRILIDPGHTAFFDHVQTGLADLGVRMEDIEIVICTHAHPDHFEAVRLFAKTSTRIGMHEVEWSFLQSMKSEITATFGVNPDIMPPDFLLKGGDLSLGALQFQVLHTPGHTPGSLSLYWPEKKALFPGDLIFKEGIGRTDLPGGSAEELKQSIKKLARLEVEWIFPGHDEIILGAEAVQKTFSEIENFWFKYI